eukprot:GHVT01087376.1.p1 GENE.GHVT01087376.1~~GHVT01087376.1.p1  ORF type:complete len:950 (-),score=97.98 GHVT01087376.1:410-3259(-)
MGRPPDARRPPIMIRLRGSVHGTQAEGSLQQGLTSRDGGQPWKEEVDGVQTRMAEPSGAVGSEGPGSATGVTRDGFASYNYPSGPIDANSQPSIGSAAILHSEGRHHLVDAAESSGLDRPGDSPTLSHPDASGRSFGGLIGSVSSGSLVPAPGTSAQLRPGPQGVMPPSGRGVGGPMFRGPMVQGQPCDPRMYTMMGRPGGGGAPPPGLRQGEASGSRQSPPFRGPPSHRPSASHPGAGGSRVPQPPGLANEGRSSTSFAETDSRETTSPGVQQSTSRTIPPPQYSTPIPRILHHDLVEEGTQPQMHRSTGGDGITLTPAGDMRHFPPGPIGAYSLPPSGADVFDEGGPPPSHLMSGRGGPGAVPSIRQAPVSQRAHFEDHSERHDPQGSRPMVQSDGSTSFGQFSPQLGGTGPPALSRSEAPSGASGASQTFDRCNFPGGGPGVNSSSDEARRSPPLIGTDGIAPQAGTASSRATAPDGRRTESWMHPPSSHAMQHVGSGVPAGPPRAPPVSLSSGGRGMPLRYMFLRPDGPGGMAQPPGLPAETGRGSPIPMLASPSAGGVMLHGTSLHPGGYDHPHSGPAAAGEPLPDEISRTIVTGAQPHGLPHPFHFGQPWPLDASGLPTLPPPSGPMTWPVHPLDISAALPDRPLPPIGSVATLSAIHPLAPSVVATSTDGLDKNAQIPGPGSQPEPQPPQPPIPLFSPQLSPSAQPEVEIETTPADLLAEELDQHLATRATTPVMLRQFHHLISSRYASSATAEMIGESRFYKRRAPVRRHRSDMLINDSGVIVALASLRDEGDDVRVAEELSGLMQMVHFVSDALPRHHGLAATSLSLSNEDVIDSVSPINTNKTALKKKVGDKAPNRTSRFRESLLRRYRLDPSRTNDILEEMVLLSEKYRARVSPRELAVSMSGRMRCVEKSRENDESAVLQIVGSSELITQPEGASTY